MVKLLNCCDEADHLLFCNHYSTLLTYTNIQFSNSQILNTQYTISTPNNQFQFVVHPLFKAAGAFLIIFKHL